MWFVDLELVQDWLDSLDDRSVEQVIAVMRVLEERGPYLGRPLVDTVTANRHRNMKELRPGSSGRSELRVLFAFDSARQAILLVAGDESGFTQAELAERIGVGQRQVSKIENGDLDNTKVATIRSYLRAVGGNMAIEYVIGDQRVQVA